MRGIRIVAGSVEEDQGLGRGVRHDLDGAGGG